MKGLALWLKLSTQGRRKECQSFEGRRGVIQEGIQPFTSACCFSYTSGWVSYGTVGFVAARANVRVRAKANVDSFPLCSPLIVFRQGPTLVVLAFPTESGPKTLSNSDCKPRCSSRNRIKFPSTLLLLLLLVRY